MKSPFLLLVLSINMIIKYGTLPLQVFNAGGLELATTDLF